MSASQSSCSDLSEGGVGDVDTDITDDQELDVDALLGDQARLTITTSTILHPVTLSALLLGHDESVQSVSFHPTSTTPLLLSSSLDRTLLVWSSSSDNGIWHPTVRLGAAGGIIGGSVGTSLLGFVGALWSPSGDMVVGQGYGGSLHLWRSNAKEQTAENLAESEWTTVPGVTGHFGAGEG